MKATDVAKHSPALLLNNNEADFNFIPFRGALALKYDTSELLEIRSVFVATCAL